MLHPIEVCLLETLHLNSPGFILVALSGGRDSIVLLHALSVVQQHLSFDLRAIHVNHALSVKASEWELFCKTYCEQLKINFESIRVKVVNTGFGVEAAAREARYKVFESCLQPNEILFTAHHQQDQIETFFLRMLRGSGLDGLTAIPAQRALGKGQLMRPLLHISPALIQNYAEQHQLTWVEDDSNFNLDFDRNYIRTEIIPALLKRWPSALTVFDRSIAQLQTDQKSLSEYRGNVFSAVTNDNRLSIEKLLLFSAPDQRALLRYWLQQNRSHAPSQKQLELVFKEVISARQDAQPCIRLGSHEIRRFDGHLYLLPNEKPLLPTRVAWEDWRLPCDIPGLGQLYMKKVLGRGFCPEKIATLSLNIGFRPLQQSLAFRARAGRQPLKKVFQSLAVPPWERGRIPLIFHQQGLIGIADYAVGAPWEVSKNEYGYWPTLIKA